jgi:hypothetical protein
MGFFSSILNIGKSLFGKVLSGISSVGSKFGGIVNKGIGAVSKIPVIGNALSGAVNALTGGADVGKAVADTASNISSDLGSGNIGGVINTIKSGVDTVKGVYDAGKRLFERN